MGRHTPDGGIGKRSGQFDRTVGFADDIGVCEKDKFALGPSHKNIHSEGFARPLLADHQIDPVGVAAENVDGRIGRGVGIDMDRGRAIFGRSLKQPLDLSRDNPFLIVSAQADRQFGSFRVSHGEPRFGLFGEEKSQA